MGRVIVITSPVEVTAKPADTCMNSIVVSVSAWNTSLSAIKPMTTPGDNNWPIAAIWLLRQVCSAISAVWVSARPLKCLRRRRQSFSGNAAGFGSIVLSRSPENGLSIGKNFIAQ